MAKLIKQIAISGDPRGALSLARPLDASACLLLLAAALALLSAIKTLLATLTG